MFGADLVINNLEVDLVASQIEAVHYGFLGLNAIHVLLGIEEGEYVYVRVAIVGGPYVLVAAASSYGEASSFVCVKLVDRFGPSLHFVREDGWNGINHEGCCSVGGIFGLRFGGADALLSLGKMTLDSFIRVVAVLGGVSVG